MKDELPKSIRRVDDFFMGRSKVHRTLERVARALEEADVSFALAGALAVNVRGHLRATAGVDILITDAGLRKFKERWLGRGYVEEFTGSNGVRDAEPGVPIDFLIAGEYPGDSKPKPVQFPSPESIPKPAGQMRVLDLETLIELKLASGISAPDRLQDLADVVALIRANRLADDFASRLNPYVREKYLELWLAAQHSRDL